MNYIAAFSIGLFGSFHCLGMCGPIALALPFGREKGWRKFTGNYAYQMGRILTYATIGALAGLVGSGFSLAGWQQPLSIATGIIMIAFIVLPRLGTSMAPNISSRLKQSTSSPFFWARKKLGKFLTVKSHSGYFAAGLLNGLLPCGLIYIAVLGSFAMPTVPEGALFMVFFGLGTFPMMFVTPLIPQLFSPNVKQYFRKAIPVFVVVMGLLFITRGMGLGIPYISPSDGALTTNQTEECH
ncbi:MAG: sulfite exporter TauE/SafE family protein [Schleiferiaceae bacterium]